MTTTITHTKAKQRWIQTCAPLLLMATLSCDRDTKDGSKDRPKDSEESRVMIPSQLSDPPTERAPAGDLRLRTIYVPAYSHLSRGGATQSRALLSILLSVRNVDSSATITLTHVDYFDTSGHRVRRYLDRPRTLQPLETAEFGVDTYDKSGGSGANFLVYWEGPSDAHALLTETVMLGHLGEGYVAFTSRGIELDRRPDPTTFNHPTSNTPANPETSNSAEVTTSPAELQPIESPPR